MTDRAPFASVPTRDQCDRFRALSPAERFRWFAGLLRTTHGLASARARDRWRSIKQAQSGGFLSIISSLVRSLDRAEFDVAANCLSASCTYEIRGEVVEGTGAVVHTYATNHAWAVRTLDRLRYRSRVEGTAPGVAIVTFEDHIEHQGKRHLYRCEQQMSVGRSKLVERILHRELDGEREALARFFESVGVRR